MTDAEEMKTALTAAQESWIKSERIRKAAPDMLAALESFPDPADFATPDDFKEATNKWWDDEAMPAIETAKGFRS